MLHPRIHERLIEPRRVDEIDDLIELLAAHASSPEAGRWAQEIAVACLGDRHLWEDLELPDRSVLSGLFKTHFNPLFVLNQGDMKWKKFLYRQLCERHEVQACRSPNCQTCPDHDQCFGPELPGTRAL